MSEEAIDAWLDDENPDDKCYTCGNEVCVCDVISLATIQDIEPAVLFASGGLDILKTELEQRFQQRPTDASTEKGRQEIIAYSMKFAKDGSLVASVGDKYIKERSVAIEEENILINNLKKANKSFKAYCTEKRKEARIPVTEFEDAEKEKERLAELALTIEQDWDDAHALDRLRTLEAEAEVRKAREAQEAHDAQVAAEAAEKAKRDAETQAENRLREAVEREATAKAAEAKAKADARAAEIQAEQDKKEAEFQAEQAKQVAVLKAQQEAADHAAHMEFNRQKEAADKAAAEALEQEERDRQSADVEHQRTINRRIIADLELIGFNETQAKVLIKCTLNGAIRDLAINY